MAETFNGGRLADDLRSLVSDAEALLRASTGAESAELQEQARATSTATCAAIPGRRSP